MQGQAIWPKTVELNVNFFNSNGINTPEASCHGWLINFKKICLLAPIMGSLGRFRQK